MHFFCTIGKYVLNKNIKKAPGLANFLGQLDIFLFKIVEVDIQGVINCKEIKFRCFLVLVSLELLRNHFYSNSHALIVGADN